MKDKDRGRAPAQARKAYTAPRLRCFGDIREITQTPVMDMASGVDMGVGNIKS